MRNHRLRRSLDRRPPTSSQRSNIGAPYSRGEERVVAVIEPERQTVRVG
jgi:hypothetical protein